MLGFKSRIYKNVTFTSFENSINKPYFCLNMTRQLVCNEIAFKPDPMKALLDSQKVQIVRSYHPAPFKFNFQLKNCVQDSKGPKNEILILQFDIFLQ